MLQGDKKSFLRKDIEILFPQ